MAVDTFLMALAVLYSLTHCLALQYHLVNVPKTWTEAQSYCRAMYTDLATINNAQDLNAVVKLTKKKKSGGQAWIGLYNDVNSWRWSLSDDRFYGYGEKEYRNWNMSAPDNDGGNESCANIYMYKFHDSNCDNRFSFLCFDGNNNAFYYINSVQMSWSNAQKYCRDHFTDLATVRNQSENQYVQSLIGPQAVAWIGLFRDTWKWSDGSNVLFQSWKARQPDNRNGNEDCALVDKWGQWDDTPCAIKYPFICYRSDKRQILRVVVQSNQNVNDPAVKTAILEKIKQSLKVQEMSIHVRVKWREHPDGRVFHKAEKTTN